MCHQRQLAEVLSLAQLGDLHLGVVLVHAHGHRSLLNEVHAVGGVTWEAVKKSLTLEGLQKVERKLFLLKFNQSLQLEVMIYLSSYIFAGMK